jgi:hypothetical protein
MATLLSNWKTSVGGLIIILIGALSTFVGIKVPGFNMDFGSALTAGLALILAKDSNVTGGTTQQ